jgi:hypothetical protein
MMESKYNLFQYHCDKLEDVFNPEYTESQSFSEVLEIVNKELRPGHQGMTMIPLIQTVQLLPTY